MILEIACNSYAACLNAEKGGADRIELFENLHEGGCTPTYGMIKQVTADIKLPIYVMIRPRGGDFVYTDEEFDIMLGDIKVCLIWGVKGVVFGILDKLGNVDKDRCAIIMSRLGHMKATFHRAIDRSNDIEKATEDIIGLGFERILTSGGKRDVSAGKEVIKNLQEKYGTKIIIMPGSGVTPDNANQLINYTGVKEIHSTAKKTFPSAMEYQHPLFNDTTAYTDETTVRLLKEKIVNL
jgi:copper homeostasis protein